MPFFMVRNDITRMNVDVIVNAANNNLSEGSGVCGAIFNAAGSAELKAECQKIGSCETGKAVITGGYNLHAGYIIHTPGPVWKNGQSNEKKLLENSYKNSLELAYEHNLESIAFPLISSGVYGYPTKQALDIASAEIQKFLKDHEMTVFLVLYDHKSFSVGKEVYPGIREFISENYIPEGFLERKNVYKESLRKKQVNPEIWNNIAFSHIKESSSEDIPKLMETFQEMLFRKIDELDIEDPEVYKKANLSRKLFSKIRSDKNYSPSKSTVIALGLALKLKYVEMQELLGKAGFTLSKSILTDVIIEYCIENNIYNIFKINEILFEQNENCLGAR